MSNHTLALILVGLMIAQTGAGLAGWNDPLPPQTPSRVVRTIISLVSLPFYIWLLWNLLS